MQSNNSPPSARHLTYLDFELEIGPGSGHEYPVAVLRSPAGEAHEMMRFPFDELALEGRLDKLQIALLRSGGQRCRDDKVEAIAMKVARDHEIACSATVEDVSDPQRKMGFDLRSVRPDGSVRFIEVKGRARVGDLELTPNEWAQANNHRDKYWLYVVFNCETKPELKRIPDPAGKAIGRPKGGVTIDASDLLNLACECD